MGEMPTVEVASATNPFAVPKDDLHIENIEEPRRPVNRRRSGADRLKRNKRRDEFKRNYLLIYMGVMLITMYYLPIFILAILWLREAWIRHSQATIIVSGTIICYMLLFMIGTVLLFLGKRTGWGLGWLIALPALVLLPLGTVGGIFMIMGLNRLKPHFTSDRGRTHVC